MSSVIRYLARYLVLPGGDVVEHGALDVCDDRIVAVHRSMNHHQIIRDRESLANVVDLGDVALTPGGVNAHSHAFQRDLRGRTEWLHPDREDEDFWSWREAMYALALGFDAPAFEEVTRRCFLEMLHAGITCVGEFHYIHHQQGGTPYPEPNELAHRVIRAAKDVGIRISLLRVAYHRAGHGKPALSEQRRFIAPDLERCLFWQQSLFDRVQGDPLVKVGVAPHSIRAVPFKWFEALSSWAKTHDAPFHTHACEQQGEIEQSLQEYGKRPMEVFDDAGVFECSPVFVHATHLSDRELELIETGGGSVCACPTTERNLGDGFLPATKLLERGVRISLGSDSHAEIDLWQEMRLVEYHERLQKERRNVLASRAIMQKFFGDTLERYDVARVLWPMSNINGAKDLGWQDLGELREGFLADFVTVDLSKPAMWNVDRESLLSHLVFASHPGLVRDVFVGGKKVL